MTQDISLVQLHDVIRAAQPGTIIIVAPDVYDRLIPDRIPAAEHVWGLCNRYDGQVRCSSAVGAGRVIVMASAEISPGNIWARGFLNKSGPVPVSEGMEAGPSPPKPPRPPTPPKPPAAPPTPTRPPRPRQRIIDT